MAAASVEVVKINREKRIVVNNITYQTQVDIFGVNMVGMTLWMAMYNLTSAHIDLVKGEFVH